MSLVPFAISAHDWPILHWDFFIVPPDVAPVSVIAEQAGDRRVLRTWRLSHDPALAIQAQPAICHAQEIDQHRESYLSFQGPVSGERGLVKTWDRGWAEILKWEADSVHIKLHGHKFKAEVRLTAIASTTGQAGMWECELLPA
jgi:hypothetical protein